MNSDQPAFSSRSDIAGLKVTIMGLGLNGGGLASARFFASQGAIVTITDKKTESELQPSIDALSDFKDIRYVLGTHELTDFSSADLVIKNPGVKLQGNEYLAAARSIETDISIFLRFTSSPILAVTGSKGKSSTVSALHFALIELGYPAFLGGNITVSPLTFLDKTSENTPVVLELSSWQLADLRGRGLLKPKIAILTPIMPDHQNWYGGMEPYVADKKLIYADQGPDDYLLCNKDDEWGAVFASEIAQKKNGPSVRWYSTSPFSSDLPGAWITEDGRGLMRTAEGTVIEILPAEVTVPGRHMKQNLLNAAQALVLYGAKPDKVGTALAQFPGIPHRLEFFHENNGIRFYNDSAATVPEAVAAALESFDRPVILLTGGTDKNLDFTPLAKAAGKAKRILLLAGTGTDKLISELWDRGIVYEGPFPDLRTMIEALQTRVETGDIVVFSPGATSFGLFLNEFDRGTQYRDAIKLAFK